MVTRSKSGIFKPKTFLAHFEPCTVAEALQDANWRQAMMEEFQALQANNTWTLVHLRPNRNAIGCKWIFRVKENADGFVQRYKARLIAKGLNQNEGFDFTENFSSVVKPLTISFVLTLALTFNWPINQLDVHNAFLNGKLEEEVFMRQPPGFEQTDKTLVCKLKKALYGLKQAPRAWFEKLTSTLNSLGFIASKCDSSLFFCSTKLYTNFVLVYVDNILVTGISKAVISHIDTALNREFSLRNLGQISYFLGVEVKRT